MESYIEMFRSMVMYGIVGERKNFKLLFSAGIVLAVGVSNLYISSN